MDAAFSLESSTAILLQSSHQVFGSHRRFGHNGGGEIRFVIRDGIAYDPAELLESAEGKIGPTGPDDRAEWELELRPLRED